MLKQCSSNVQAMFKQCSSNAQAMFKQCASNAQAMFKQCSSNHQSIGCSGMFLRAVWEGTGRPGITQGVLEGPRGPQATPGEALQGPE
eukprot:2393331-Alexandrium_andersonii.AAC.1